MQTEEQQPTRKKKNYVRKAARILLKVILFLLLFVVVLFLLILTPPVQRFATSKAETYLQKKLKTKVEIGRIGFTLSGKVNLKDIYVEDQSKDTLIAGGNIQANVSLGKLLSNEIEVKDISFENITAKIKRTLPDTVFNFQFITDAFVTEKTKNTDTAQSAPLKLAIYKLDAVNSNFVYKDVVTGNDMVLRVGNLSARIDSLNLETSHFVVPSFDLSDVNMRFNQTTPLAAGDPIATDMAAAAEPITMKLDFGKINLNRINLLYSNDISDLYSQLNIGELSTEGKNLDLQNQVVHLKNLALNNTTAIIRSGDPKVVKVATKEIGQEVEAQTTQKNWDFRIDDIRINNNKIQYDDETKPRQKYGMDFAHLNADSLTLHIENLVMATDSMGANITRGYMREKNGFNLQELKADILYSSTQTSVKDFYVKTPGTELKRDFLLTYNSYKALTDSFQNAVMDINIDESHVQVRDILHFAPQLRSQAAFSNPNDVWYLNAQVTGTMDRLNIEALQFNGLKNTNIDAYGTLASLTNPANAGANLTIRKFQTSQSDIALFTGARLSTAQINVPETFDIRGTVAGNAGNMRTNLQVNTSAGNIALNGRFTNLTNPKTATYNADIRTNGLRLGSILRNPQLGSLSAAFNVAGRGLMPDAMNTNFKGNIFNVGYNNYNYRNIALNGSMDGASFKVNVDANDPNASFNLTTSGILAATPSFMVSGFIDSVKTLPLHLTTQPLVLRGRIDADIPSANPDNLLADVLISEALFVSGANRMPIDSLRLISGKSDTGQFIRLNSDFINAQLTGSYRLTELGSIIQNTMQPYFPVSNYTATTISQPYDVSFNADLIYHPVLASFVPGLKSAKPIHAEGRLTSREGMQALITAPSVVYGTNEINDLKININTADSGMVVNGTVAHLKSGSSLDLFNTRLNASILNNNINFNFRVGDASDRDKYVLSGLVTQPGQGNINISLLPGNLLLNYEQWTISPGNSISIRNEQLFANNFILQKGSQQLSLNGGGANPLDLGFKEFKLATITGFIKSDSLLVDGTMNGVVSFKNILQQPVFTSNLAINDLSFKQDTVGNINMQVSSSGNSYITDVNVTGRGNDVRLTGSFAPQGASDIALNLKLAVNRLELNSFEGAMAAFVKSASGAVNGNVSINGTAAKPKIQGALNFDSAAISTNLLGGPLFINDEKITVTENGFVFDNFTIRDSARNTLNVNGNVVSSNFINYAFQLDVDAKNFRALNTTIKDNKIFYGQLFINSNLHIGGTEKLPIIDGALTVNEGTNFTIVVPQTEPGIADREGVVVFTDFNSPENDSLFMAYDSLNVSSVLGFDIATNLEIKKEAVFNIVIDAANGDLLNIQGTGQLSAGIDPSGKINLTGSYEIEKGAYQFSFNMLKRRFEIDKGSKIVWLGEPTNAQIDLKAIYTTNAAPLDLVETQLGQDAAQRNFYLQKLPFQVHLNLSGELMKPVIGFDIVLPTGSNYNVGNEVLQNVNSRLAQIREEPSELNKQVFSVLLLNRFTGENPFESSSGGGFSAGSFARQSVSRLMTEQLNQLAAGLIEGVDINFDVASSDDYSTGEKRNRTDLNVGLSKRLLNDRLTVTVGSNFELEGPQQSNQSSNNIAGNVAVNYQLSKDGRYMLRFYRKNDYQGVVDGYIIETGLGFIMTVDYNRFKEIIQARKVRKQRQARIEANNQNQQQNGNQ